jgi:hypothetical protein
MNEELSKLEQRLELATGRDLPPESPLDPETASLREAWLALSQLLEAAEEASPKPVKLRPMPPPRHHGWRLAATAAMAVSLLVAVTLAWQLLPSRPTGRPTAERNEPSARLGKGGVAKAQGLHTEPVASLPAWEDSLDESIAQAQQAVVRLEQDWRAGGDGTDPVYDRLEQLRKEIGENPI